jgi:hypothetical protein
MAKAGHEIEGTTPFEKVLKGKEKHSPIRIEIEKDYENNTQLGF